MKRDSDEYREYADHPRYGRRPRYTGLNPHEDFASNTVFHWHSPKDCRIPNTAIPADPSRLGNTYSPVSHYFDVKQSCRDCGKSFIFFAEEQKFWYEELGFALASDCVRCVVCRKQQQGIARKHQRVVLKRQRYEELFHISDHTVSEQLEMADICLTLIEQSIFHSRQTERVRMLLNKLSAEQDDETRNRCNQLLARVIEIEGSRGRLKR